jgi:NAD(P)-dependent dehydrogenase (short-subunit alcohol dehydrogenase family)
MARPSEAAKTEGREMRELRGGTCVVTGAASGIGFALCERLAAEGMSVVMSDVEPAALAIAAASLKERGARVHSVVTDVSNAGDVRALAEECLRAFGGVSVLCNNAGIFEAGGSPSWTTSADDWSWIIGVNLMGVVHGLSAFVPILLEQTGGAHVVNTASIGGFIAGNALYSATKFGVVAITETLYQELRRMGSQVGVSLLCPGYVKTRLASSERNRPIELAHASPATQTGATVRRAFAQSIDAGIDAREVAEHTLSAILEDRFYVFTHPDSLPSIEEKVATMREGRNPVVRMVRPAAQR